MMFSLRNGEKRFSGLHLNMPPLPHFSPHDLINWNWFSIFTNTDLYWLSCSDSCRVLSSRVTSVSLTHVWLDYGHKLTCTWLLTRATRGLVSTNNILMLSDIPGLNTSAQGCSNSRPGIDLKRIHYYNQYSIFNLLFIPCCGKFMEMFWIPNK